MGFLGTHREHLQLQCPTCDTGSVCESVAGLIHCPAVHPSLHPSILLQSWQQSTEGNLPPGRPALERWVGVLIDSRSVGGKEEFALSCQTSRWIEAYMMMLRVEYTCSFLLGGRGEKQKDAASSAVSPLQAAETRGRIKSFWVCGVSLLFGFSLIRCSRLFVGCVFVFSSCSPNI